MTKEEKVETIIVLLEKLGLIPKEPERHSE